MKARRHYNPYKRHPKATDLTVTVEPLNVSRICAQALEKEMDRMDHCEATLECEQPIAFIVDCDECKNIFVCSNHVGTVINRHAETCEGTLHVDMTGSPAERPVKVCAVCGGEGEHDWEVHNAELRAIDDRE